MKTIIFILSLTLSSFSIAATESLLKTYQREMAFLVSQKKNLKTQLKKVNRTFGKKVKLAKIKNENLQNELLGLGELNEQTTIQINETSKSLENAESNQSMVDTTITQARISLGINEEDFKSLGNKEDKLNYAFFKAWQTLGNSKKIYSTNGKFYLQNGTKVEGEILKLGNIASFGFYQDQAAMLMPVGAGNLKLTGLEFSQQIKDFKMGKASWVPVFLYENIEKAIEPKKDKTIMETLQAGGLVAYVIAALGLLALLLVLVRMFLLYRASKVDKNVLVEIKSGELSEAFANKLDNLGGPLGRVLQKTYGAFYSDREARENIIQESILGELNFLDKFGALILVLAAVSPLLGLLGTVTGMISTFDIITEFGTGDPKLLSSGISEALITTKLGLVVAIPALLMGNLLGSWSTKIKLMLETEALRLSNLADSDKAEEFASV